MEEKIRMKSLLRNISCLMLLSGICIVANPVQAMEEVQESPKPFTRKVTPLTPEQVESALCAHPAFPRTEETTQQFPALITRHYTGEDGTKKATVSWNLIVLKVPDDKTPEDITKVEFESSSSVTNYHTCSYCIEFNGIKAESPEKGSGVIFRSTFELPKEIKAEITTKKTVEEIMGSREEQFEKRIRGLESLYLTESEINETIPLVLYLNDGTHEMWKLSILGVIEPNKTASDIKHISHKETLYEGAPYQAEIFIINFDDIPEGNDMRGASTIGFIKQTRR